MAEGGVCYGCVHCGCNPDDPDDFCWMCDECDPCTCSQTGVIDGRCPEHGDES